MLESKEKEWNAKQKELQIPRIQQKLFLSLKRKDYKKFLQTGKSWDGPCTTQDELESTLASNPSIQEKIVKVEVTYYRHTHKPEAIARADMFKLNKITHEERLENFLILLLDVDNAKNVQDVLNATKATLIEKVTTNTIQYVSEFKACICYFLSNFYFSRNDSPSKTMKNVFYFI